MIGFAEITELEGTRFFRDLIQTFESADPAQCIRDARWKSWALLEQLTHGYVDRGERHLKQQNLAGAWDDLVRAEQLAPTDTAARSLREELTRLGFQQLRTHLEAGEPQRALESLARLGERAAVHAEYRPLEDAVKDWLLTIELADRGEFGMTPPTVNAYYSSSMNDINFPAAVRREYGWVTEPQWKLGRRAVLAQFLARPAIYATARFRASHEAAARHNLARAIARLDRSAGQANGEDT